MMMLQMHVENFGVRAHDQVQCNISLVLEQRVLIFNENAIPSDQLSLDPWLAIASGLGPLFHLVLLGLAQSLAPPVVQHLPLMSSIWLSLVLGSAEGTLLKDGSGRGSADCRGRCAMRMKSFEKATTRVPGERNVGLIAAVFGAWYSYS